MLQAGGRQQVVRIEKDNVIALGEGESLVAAGIGPLPVSLADDGSEAAILAGIALRDAGGAILGTVVDHDSLPMGIGLLAERIQCLTQQMLAIVAWDDDAGAD